MNRDGRYAAGALVFLSFAWGYNWVLMKEALEYAGPFDFAAWRTGIGAGTLFLILLMRRRLRRPAKLRGLAILGMFQIAAFTALTMLALVNGDPGKMSVLVYTMPVWAMVFAWGLLGQKPTHVHAMATGAALVGIVCMAQPWQPGLSYSGLLYALGGAAAWGFSSVYASQLRHAGVDVLSMTAWSLAVGGVILVAVACLVPSAPVRWDPYFVFILLYNAVLATAVAWLLWAYVLDRLSIMAASLSVLAVPLIGSLSSAARLGERFSSSEMVGMGTILLSIGVVYWKAGMSDGQRFRSRVNQRRDQ